MIDRADAFLTTLDARVRGSRFTSTRAWRASPKASSGFSRRSRGSSVDLGQPRVGYMCNSLAPVPAYKRELHARELAAAEAASVDSLVGIYHACHRELCAHELTSPFTIVNFLELVGEAMGIERYDLFKEWKMIQDVDRVLAEVAGRAIAVGLDLESVREVLVAHILGEQPLPIEYPAARIPGSATTKPPRFFPE